jgi:hypothetical protein
VWITGGKRGIGLETTNVPATAPESKQMKVAMRIVIPIIPVIVLAVGVWAWRDYRSWLALGPGGVPYNLQGWAQVTRMRLWKKNPLDPKLFADKIGKRSDIAALSDIPNRAGNRPTIDPHPVPHRQKDQFGDEQTRKELRALFDRLIASHPQLLHYQKSTFERRHEAIFLRAPGKGTPNTKALGEIGHIHPSDGSMHITLSPSDAKKVMEAGWGELHTLAGDGGPLPDTYLMIYSPRNKEELAVVEEILKAAVKYHAGNLLRRSKSRYSERRNSYAKETFQTNRQQRLDVGFERVAFSLRLGTRRNHLGST